MNGAATLEWRDIRHRDLPTYRQIDYWIRTGAIVPSRPARGSGSRREWTEHECDKLEALRRLDIAMRRFTEFNGLPTELVAEVWFGLDEADHHDIINYDDGKITVLLRVAL